MSTDTGRNILLVEDERIVALNEKRDLQKAGYAVAVVSSGEAAVEEIRTNDSIALVLMDIDLGPGIDGTEAAEEILRLRSLPVIFLTRHAEDEYVERAQRITGFGYVLKSSDSFALLQAIRMAFDLFAAHQRLRESEEKYRAAFMTTPEAVNINGLDGRYVDINQGFTDLTGYTPEDVIGRLSSEIEIWSVPEDRERLVEGLRNRGAVDGLESLFRCKDGTIKTAVMAARIIAINGAAHILSVTRDITQQKLREAQLKASEERFRALFDNAAEGILVQQLGGVITSANYSMERITGYAREELVGKQIEMLFSSDELERTPLRYDLVGAGELVRRERVLRRKDGTTISVVMISTRVTADSLQAIFHDVTDLREAEAALRNSEERFRLAVEGSRDGLWDWNLLTDEAYFSDQFAEMLGYERSELPPTSAAWSDLLHPDDREKALECVREHVEGNAPYYESTFRMRAKDGSYRWITGRGKAEHDESGRGIRLVGFNTDVTGEVERRAEIERLLQEKDALLAEVNHRVKNNLAMVSALLGLKEASLGDGIDLSDISNQIDAIRLVYDKLNQSGDATEVALSEYVEELVHPLTQLGTEQAIRFVNGIPSINVPSRTAVTLGLIINELVTNAVKYGFCPESEATLMVSLDNDGEDGLATLSVSNSGKPFPEDLDPAQTSTLGLSLVSAMAHQLDGTLRLERSPQTTFTIEFPQTNLS